MSGSGTVLDKIADSVRQRLEGRKALRSPAELARLCEGARKPHDFGAPFKAVAGGPAGGAQTRIIAEIKFTSPSQGRLSSETAISPVEAAGAYLRSGATAISILTEQDHFQGKLEYLAQVRAAYPHALLLMKDFVVDEYQLQEGRLIGADAALLIVALLGERRTGALLAVCRGLGLTALVEVHHEAEFEIATRLGATLIGVNNRDLKTLAISLGTSDRLARLPHPGASLISESGLSEGAELRRLRGQGYAGFLIGTTFMKTGDPGKALAQLLAEAR